MGAPQIREQVDRIAASRGFQASERMGRLLRFVVAAALEGRAEQLKEYLLGVEVFDRSTGFDPRTDPIVRVEARRLRSKLKLYYQTDGCSDRIVIAVPTGGYVPSFDWKGEDRVAPEPGPKQANIAILPFSNLSPEPDTDYFSDGLTEEIIHALTKVEGLSVVAWHSAAKLKDEQADVAGIGHRLRVDTVLQGSVRRWGDRLRILVKLVETATARIVWTETYDRRLEDLFAIQEDISRRVAESLRITLLGGEQRHSGVRQWNIPAYDLYLRGRFHWNKRTLDGFQRAVQCFTEAVACDPQFAPGYAGLADAYSLMAQRGMAAPSTVIQKAKGAALTALEMDGDLAEAHASLALIESLYEWKWESAEQHYRRAITIQPGYATAHHWYGCDFLALQRRFDESIASMTTARRLDPLSPVIASSSGYASLLARRYDEGIALQRQALDLDPHYATAITAMGRICLHQGNHAKAVELLEKGRRMESSSPAVLGALAQAYGMSGNPAAARELIAEMTLMVEARYVPSTAFALAHVGLGEHDRALHWLELACDRHEPTVCGMGAHPGYDDLRGHPRFQALLRKVGLPGI